MVINAKFLKGIKGEDPVLRRSSGQVAFLGRSNVGKSSVINSIVGKKLAFSSNTPGRTQEINVYETDKKFSLLDFPGYGYAKVPEPIREKLRKMILWYIAEFQHNKRLFILVIDSKVGLQDYDKEVIDIFNDEGHNYLVVANKSDKLNQSEKSKIKKELDFVIPESSYLLYSATKKTGRKELIRFIENII